MPTELQIRALKVNTWHSWTAGDDHEVQ